MFTRKKVGSIHAISREDNIGLICEEFTGTKFMFFLDEVKKAELAKLSVGMPVTFHLDTDYEITEFMATNVQTKRFEDVYRKAI